MLPPANNHRNVGDFVLLRYVLIIAVSYLIISQQGLHGMAPASAGLIAAALASNLILGRIKPELFTVWQIAGAIVIVDTAWISASLAVVGKVGTEFFFLYFFILFFAALADNLGLMLVGVVAAAGGYLWVLGRLYPGSVWRQEHLLQISLLFSAALFYGVLVHRTRLQRKHAETIEVSDKARTELLATLAHDIGGPANVITLGVETLKDTFDQQSASEMRSVCSAVTRNSRYLGQLVQHFLEYARLRAGRYRLHPTELSVSSVIEQVAAQHEIDARGRGVVLRLVLEPTPQVILDEIAVVRILNNLIGNALRYSNPGNEVIVHAAGENNGIRIVVGDSGPGLSAEQQQRIGEPFTDTSGAHGGAGLGLFIARSLAEAQGGSLTANSGPGGAGARFVVRLPLAAPVAADATAQLSLSEITSGAQPE